MATFGTGTYIAQWTASYILRVQVAFIYQPLYLELISALYFLSGFCGFQTIWILKNVWLYFTPPEFSSAFYLILRPEATIKLLDIWDRRAGNKLMKAKTYEKVTFYLKFGSKAVYICVSFSHIKVRPGLGYHWCRTDRVLVWTQKLQETQHQFYF